MSLEGERARSARRLIRLLVAGVAAASLSVAACSSSDSGSNASGSPCNGADPNADCTDCGMSMCSNQFADVESQCGDFLACESSCGCSDVGCIEGCSGSIQGACAQATTALTTCQDNACATACGHASTSTGTSTGTGTPTHNCAALATCCPSLPMQAQSGCQTVAMVNDDSICAEELQSFEAASYCH